ncbi:MAG TPA: hypothetical protein VJX70_03365 [Candidatus Acidoferrum sp.]|nr:hypothetical protein [Candidatus Acidoferrum sp.]
MKRFGLVAITALFALLGVARTNAQQVTVNVNMNGQPASGVSVVFIAANLIKTPQAQPNAQPAEGNANALNLSNMLKTRTVTTDSSGTSVLDLSNIIKPKGQTQVQITVRSCKDGKNVVYIVQSAAEIPPQDQKCVNTDDCKCKDRAAGLYLIHDGDKITVNITPGTVEVHVTHAGGGGATAKGFYQVVSIDLGGGVGFKNLGGTHGEMLPGGTFSTPSPTAFSGDVGAALNIGPVSFANYYYAANGISSNGSTSLPGGGTDTVNVNRTVRGDTLTAGVGIPLGSRLSFNVHGGGDFWHVNIDTKETVSGGTTSSNSRGVDGTSWTVGAAVRVKISGRWSFFAGYDYLPMKNAGVNVHLNEGSFGVMYRLFGKSGQ